MKTAIINARVKPELKQDVEQILSQLGIRRRSQLLKANDGSNQRK